jgi:serine/threonine-protein kinase
MKHPGPLFTLLAGVVLAAGIGIANLVNGAAQAPPSTAGAVTTPSPAPKTDVTTASSAQTPASAPARADYAGRVDGGGASVAVSVRDGQGIAYVCDGKKVEAWLQGGAADGRVDLQGAKGSTLIGSRDAATVTGTVTVDARTWRFTIPLATKPAGLYRATPTVQGRPAKVGWIVQPDGSQVGVLTAGGTSTSAPPLNPAAGTATVDGSPIAAESISGLIGKGAF